MSRLPPPTGYAIGIDIGGTKVAAGLVDPEGRITSRVRRESADESPAAVQEMVLDVARELAAGSEATAIGVGAPGFVDETGSVVRFAANVGWRELPLRTLIEAATGLPTTVENDANAAAWGEARFGAGAGVRDMVFVGVGTGIGGGIVLGGELYRGHFGIAAEFGHVRVVPDGRPCGCGKRGCWEQYASGSALVREARDRAAERSGATGALNGPQITAAARAGDPLAIACFDEVGYWLGQGMADLVAVLDPDVIVVGGGVSEAGELLMAPAREAFARALVGAEHRPVPELRLAEMGNDAGLAGAGDLGRRVTVKPR